MTQLLRLTEEVKSNQLVILDRLAAIERQTTGGTSTIPETFNDAGFPISMRKSLDDAEEKLSYDDAYKKALVR